MGQPCRRPSGHRFGRSGFFGEDQAHAVRRHAASRVRIEGLHCADCQGPDGPGHFVAPIRDGPEARRLGVVGRDVCGPCAELLRTKAAAS